jgi:hypothetical protein
MMWGSYFRWLRGGPNPLWGSLAAGVALMVILLGFQLLRPRAPAAQAPVAETETEDLAQGGPPPPGPAPTPAPVAETRSPQRPTLPELHRGGAPAGDPRPVERALTERSAEELQLGGQLARAGLETPPELAELFRRRERGDSLAALRRFVVDRFPRDLKLRALTLDWLERHPRR